MKSRLKKERNGFWSPVLMSSQRKLMSLLNKQKMKMDWLVNSNAFREKVKEKRREIEQVEEKIKRADKKLQQI